MAIMKLSGSDLHISNVVMNKYIYNNKEIQCLKSIENCIDYCYNTKLIHFFENCKKNEKHFHQLYVISFQNESIQFNNNNNLTKIFASLLICFFLHFIHEFLNKNVDIFFL